MREKLRKDRYEKPAYIYPSWRKQKRLNNKKIRRTLDLCNGGWYRKISYTLSNLA